MMMTLMTWMRRRLGWLVLAGIGLTASGPALADTYNILLKSGTSTTQEICAIGGFTFTKTVAGATFSAPATMELTSNCLGLGNGTFQGNVTVVVENVTINGQAQGPNVVGLRGSLTRTNGSNTSTIAFQYVDGSASTGTPIRTTTYTSQNGANTTTNGAYHIVNTLHDVPEPNMLWLVGAALGALLLVRRSRNRA